MKRLLFVVTCIFALSACQTIHVTPTSVEGETPAAASAQTESGEEEEDDPFEPWDDTLEDTEEIEGFITFHVKRDRTLLAEISPEMLGEDFGMLMHYSRGVGDFNVQNGLYLSNTRLMRFNRVGDKVYLVHRNTRFTADDGSALHSAMQENIGHSILGAFEIKSKHEESDAVLIDVTEFFVSDYAGVSDQIKMYYGNKPVGFDKARSYVSDVMGFPENVEIDALLTFAPSDYPVTRGAGVSDHRSIPVGVRYSLFELPENPMTARPADDRVGYFLTAQFNFSRDQHPDAFVRYINRWRLEKEDPDAELSEPVEPIVFFIDRSVPEQYRKYVRQGIENWNKAFRAAGFQNAVVAKLAPDDSTWSAADVRYSTIRWTPSYNMGYAIGPSQVDPRTGEILNADILISALWPHFLLRDWDFLTAPDAMFRPYQKMYRQHQQLPDRAAAWLCTAEGGKMRQLSLQYTLMAGRGMLDPTKPMPEEYVGGAIRDLIMHEVGHTLGLRHNFKASSAIPYERLHDKAFTSEHGVTLSVMDYGPVNVSLDPNEQGHYWNPEVGSYDVWAIRYGYSTNDELAGSSESYFAREAALNDIAEQSTDPMHAYGTDEDAIFGAFGVDPLTTRNDLSTDALRWAQDRTTLVDRIQPRLSERLIGEGMAWNRLRSALSSLIFARYSSLSPVIKSVGGLYVVRDHKGDPNARAPFTPVSADKQRAAVALVVAEAFAPDAFQFEPELLNSLAPSFRSEWGINFDLQVAFPIHDYVAMVQGALLSQMLHPARLARMIDNEVRMPGGAAPYRVGEFFDDLSSAIWSELDAARDVNSFRRNLQRMHIEQLATLLLHDQVGFANSPVPEDARSLARLELALLSEQIDDVLNSRATLNRATRAHLASSEAHIGRALDVSLTEAIE